MYPEGQVKPAPSAPGAVKQDAVSNDNYVPL
jgi:hypothetical protein